MLPSDINDLPGFLEHLDTCFDELVDIADGAYERLSLDGEILGTLDMLGINNTKSPVDPPDFPNPLGQMTPNQYGYLVVMARIGYTTHCKLQAKRKLQADDE